MALFKKKEVILLLRLIVGGVFIYASFDKIQHSDKFAISVRAYQIIPIAVSNLFALSVAWTELVAGSMLVLGLFTRKAAAAIGLLTVTFISAVLIVLIKGLIIDCGCFKAEGGSAVGPMLLVRNIFLLAGAILIMRFDTGEKLTSPKSRRGRKGPGSQQGSSPAPTTLGFPPRRGG